MSEDDQEKLAPLQGAASSDNQDSGSKGSDGDSGDGQAAGSVDLRQALTSKLLITAAAAVLLALHAYRVSIFAHPDTFTIGLLIAAALPWLLALVSSAEFPGGWKFNFRLVQSRVMSLENKAQITQFQMANLYALSMSDATFYQLQRLADGTYTDFGLAEDRTIGLNGELNYLKILGYITFDTQNRINGKLIRGVEDLPTGNNKTLHLSDYIHVTEQGREFIKLRLATKHASSFLPTAPPMSTSANAAQILAVGNANLLPSDFDEGL